MSARQPKKWRYSMGRHYYEDDKYGYAYIDKLEHGYSAIPGRRHVGQRTFDRLRDAKAWVEAQWRKS